MSKLTCCNSQDEARAKRTKTKRLRPGTLPPQRPVQKQKVSGTLLRQKKRVFILSLALAPPLLLPPLDCFDCLIVCLIDCLIVRVIHCYDCLFVCLVVCLIVSLFDCLIVSSFVCLIVLIACLFVWLIVWSLE